MMNYADLRSSSIITSTLSTTSWSLPCYVVEAGLLDDLREMGFLQMIMKQDVNLK